METKTCSRCTETKPLSEFGIDNRRGTSKAICKPCDVEVHRLHYQKPDVKKERARYERYRYQWNGQRQKCWRCGKKSAYGRRYCEECAAMRTQKARDECRTRERICKHCSRTFTGLKARMCWECRDPKSDRFKSYQREWRITLKREVFDSYGGRECRCCGELEFLFLTIDHVNNDGAAHRKVIQGAHLYGWLKRNKFPKGFQVLCMNCQWGKKLNGGICPHETKSA